ncbi:MAG: NAD(P)H-dependent oxidoreductase [Simkaniaceae bacterium]|nr:NAD(P)H-dependent oxidoreductase [Simkaniaceae bacterium]
MSRSLLIFSGSLRKESYSKQIAKNAYYLAQELKLKATYTDLNEYPLPLLNQDETAFEAFPKIAKDFRAFMASHEAWVIVTPEHNYSIPASLKNAIDWASRPINEKTPVCEIFQMKPVLILSSSVGPFGGIRAANHLQTILSSMGANVYPKTKSYIKVQEMLNEKGSFIDNKELENLKTLLLDFTETLS